MIPLWSLCEKSAVGPWAKMWHQPLHVRHHILVALVEKKVVLTSWTLASPDSYWPNCTTGQGRNPIGHVTTEYHSSPCYQEWPCFCSEYLSNWIGALSVILVSFWFHSCKESVKHSLQGLVLSVAVSLRGYQGRFMDTTSTILFVWVQCSPKAEMA